MADGAREGPYLAVLSQAWWEAQHEPPWDIGWGDPPAHGYTPRQPPVHTGTEEPWFWPAPAPLKKPPPPPRTPEQQAQDAKRQRIRDRQRAYYARRKREGTWGQRLTPVWPTNAPHAEGPGWRRGSDQGVPADWPRQREGAPAPYMLYAHTDVICTGGSTHWPGAPHTSVWAALPRPADPNRGGWRCTTCGMSWLTWPPMGVEE